MFENLRKDNDVGFREYFTPAPYWRCLSCADQRVSAHVLPCLCNELLAGEVGFVELIIQPCESDWGNNVFNLCVAERDGGVPLHVLNDWREAGFGRDFSDKARQKMNVPMYAVIIRVGAICNERSVDSVLKTLSLPVAGLLWGGQRLKHLTEQDYIKAIGEEKALDMILASKSYRAGSLFSLDELSPLSLFLEKEDLLNPRFTLDIATGLYVPDNLYSGDGAYIGKTSKAGKELDCILPEEFRKRGMSVRSVNGGGKSNLDVQIFGHDLERKRKFLQTYPGVKMSIVMVDLSDDAYRFGLHKLKKEDASYVKIFNPTLRKGYVPKYNVVDLRDKEDIDRKADYLTCHFRNLYNANEWGGGIELIIKNAFYLLLASSKAVLTDMRDILDTGKVNAKRERALEQLDNDEVHKFWKHDFWGIDDRRKNVALRKVTGFLSDKRVQAMFSVKENCFDASEMLGDGGVLLCNCSESEIGETAARLLAGSIVNDVCNAGRVRARNYSPNQRKLMPCYLTVDEFYKIFHKEFESLTVSMRKYNVCLNLSYHFDEQLSKELQSGIRNFGTHIALKQSFDQAKSQAYPQFLGKVEPNDFINLKPGHGYMVTPDSQVKPFESDLQEEDGDQEAIDMIVEKNLSENYVKISDIKEEKEQEAALKKESLRNNKRRMGEPI